MESLDSVELGALARNVHQDKLSAGVGASAALCEGRVMAMSKFRNALLGLSAGAAVLAGSMVDNTAQAAVFTCAASDVSLDLNGAAAGGTLNATTCSTLNIDSNGTNTYLTALNSAFSSYGAFIYVDRTGDPSGTLPGGISISLLTSSLNNTQGSWTVDWQDNQPNVAPNLPATIDLAVVFKAANTEVGYLFDNLLLVANPSEYSGSFEIRWTNNGDQVPGLSHIFGGGANLTTVPSDIPVPEPMSLALLGTGLLGLGLARRARRK